MTSERKKGEFRKGDVFYLDRHFKLKDIEAAIATKVYAQALADVDAAAEELLSATLDFWGTFTSEELHKNPRRSNAHAKVIDARKSLTQAILSTGGE